MCGICGIFEFNKNIETDILKNMCNVLIHRGPDDQGIYVKNNIGLGHRRLSIIDISCGHQPMSSQDKKIHIIYNGEIYNFLELKIELEEKGYKFVTKSDTEVLLASYIIYGKNCLKYICGMFVFAIFDERDNSIFIARDHIGIKPLVYYYDSERFVFSSELYSLLQYKDIKRAINIEALSDYISFQCVPYPQTMFENIYKLPPAHYLILKEKKLSITKYWELDYNNKITFTSEQDAINEVWTYFKKIVSQHLISDVPVGLFLSGGVDSTLVTAAVCEQMNSKVKTFSIGFDYEDYSEVQYSRQVAKVFDTEHTEIIVKPDILNIILDLVKHFGEPFADSSAVPTYYVSKMTREYVKVALSGDGGDELFAGYKVYAQMNLVKKFNSILSPFHKFFEYIKNSIKNSDSKRNLPKIIRFLTLSSGPLNEIYTSLRMNYYNEIKERLFSDEFKKEININYSKKKYQTLFNELKAENFIEKILNIDTIFTLPNLYCAKVDIASLMNSLEVRVPFLDKRMAEFAFSLPIDYKIKGTVNKYILKKILKKFFPDEFIYRKKCGFSIPLAEWMRVEMKKFVEEILFDNTKNDWYFNNEYIKKLYNDHQRRIEDNSATIWSLINFKIWQNIFIK